MRRNYHAGLLAILVLVFIGTAAFGQGAVPSGAAAANNGRTIEVNGHGEAKARPDTMLLVFVVDATGVSADESTNLLIQRAKTLTDALKPKVGDKGSITTANFSIENLGEPSPKLVSAAAWRCDGIITAGTYDIANVGKLVEAAIKAGAEPTTTQLGSKRVRTGFFSSTRVRTVTAGFQFEVRAVSADECTHKAAARENQIERALRDELRGNGSVSLSAFSVTPLGQQRSFRRESPSQETRTVFEAHETVSVKSKDVGLLGPVIEAAGKAGARLTSLTFTLSENAAARTEAIRLASEDAQAKAAAVAKSMGVKLGSLIKISTTARPSPRVVYVAGVPEALALGGGSVVPDEVDYDAEVSVTYQIE